MSLTKILKAPIKLFKKQVITFLIIRRHDLGSIEDKLRYIGVKPDASISNLRQKVWYLLDLPDYCEEIILLKSGDKELPLTELRKGNDPQHPYILEVWLPEIRSTSTSFLNKNMLTMGESEQNVREHENSSNITENNKCQCIGTNGNSNISIDTIAINKLQRNKQVNFMYSDFKKPDIESRMSSISIFKLHRGKSRDSFTNILFKIQSDLSTLSNKLSHLENRLPA